MNDAFMPFCIFQLKTLLHSMKKLNTYSNHIKTNERFKGFNGVFVEWIRKGGEMMGYIAPISHFQYQDYQVRMLRDKLKYMHVYPVSKLYNEKEEVMKHVEEGRKSEPKRPNAAFLKKGVYIDTFA